MICDAAAENLAVIALLIFIVVFAPGVVHWLQKRFPR